MTCLESGPPDGGRAPMRHRHMRHRPMRKHPARLGVALIEVVVTLTLLALLAAVVGPTLRPPPPSSDQEGASRRESIRRTAIREGRSLELVDSAGAPYVVDPLGTCHPAPSVNATTSRVTIWDPVRCTAQGVVDALDDGVRP